MTFGTLMSDKFPVVSEDREVFADLKKAEQIVLYRRLCITKFPLPPQLLIMIQEEKENQREAECNLK